MQIPDLTLPRCGGVVRFRDDDDLTGGEYQALRRYVARKDTDGVDVVNYGLALLIAGWDIPGMPGLPLPVLNDGNVDHGGLPGLRWQDVQALEVAVAPFLNEAISGVQRPRDVPPTVPASA